MTGKNKGQRAILDKLSIKELNPMQKQAHDVISSNKEIILLSPTGTGKTLAFLLPIIENLDPTSNLVQVLILVPSRELAIQIEQVIREMGSGYKTNAVYGGRSGAKDKVDLKHAPAILVGTPGRVADHMRRETIETNGISTLVLDEFDKSLEVGFEYEMREILESLTSVSKKVLTSATQKVSVPDFMEIEDPKTINFLSEKDKSSLKLRTVVSTSSNKLLTLEKLLHHTGTGRGIIFCNFKDSIQSVSDFLDDHNLGHVSFYGGLEQKDRERALIKFRNGSQRLLLATDLAARGIDVPSLDFIIHYELPFKKEEFIHRNGRTARMHSEGTAYLIQSKNESLPDFIEHTETIDITSGNSTATPEWETLYISGGRKDKISKGDIAGLFFKQGNLEKGELGTIELKQDCAFVAVSKNKAQKLIAQLNNSKLKKKKVRISLLN